MPSKTTKKSVAKKATKKSKIKKVNNDHAENKQTESCPVDGFEREVFDDNGELVTFATVE